MKSMDKPRSSSVMLYVTGQVRVPNAWLTSLSATRHKTRPSPAMIQ